MINLKSSPVWSHADVYAHAQSARTRWWASLRLFPNWSALHPHPSLRCIVTILRNRARAGAGQRGKAELTYCSTQSTHSRLCSVPANASWLVISRLFVRCWVFALSAWNHILRTEQLAWVKIRRKSRSYKSISQKWRREEIGQMLTSVFSDRLLFILHFCFHSLYQCFKDGRKVLLLCLNLKSANQGTTYCFSVCQHDRPVFEIAVGGRQPSWKVHFASETSQ